MSDAAEFARLLATVEEQAEQRAAQGGRVGAKPPRMPTVRGVEPKKLRQWMPALIAAFDARYTAAVRKRDDESVLLLMWMT